MVNKNISLILTFLFIDLWIVYPVASQNNEEQLSRLRTKLLENYNKNYLPSKNENNTMTVRFGLALNNQNLDDVLQTMSINAWLIVLWDDDNLKWNKEEFGGLSRIHLYPDNVWTPDLALHNSKNSESFVTPETIPLVVIENGMVMWFPPFWGEVPCKISLTKWPSDYHSCKFTFSIWSHGGEMIEMETLVDNKYGGVILDNYEDNSKWILETVTSKKEVINFGQKQVVLSFHISVKRSMTRLMSYISTSAFAVIIVLISSYGLPIKFQVIRLVFHLFSLFIFALFCSVLTVLIPSKEETPIIVIYYWKLSLLTLFSLVINTMLMSSLLLSKVFGENGNTNFRPLKQTHMSKYSVRTMEEELHEEVEFLPVTSEPGSSELSGTPRVQFLKRTFSILWFLNIVISAVFALSFLLLYFNMKRAVF